MLPINNDDEEPQQRLDYAFEMLSFTDQPTLTLLQLYHM